MIIGERIYLREIEEEDLDVIIEWRNDPKVLKWLFSYLPLNKAKQQKWYKRYVNNDTQQMFIIEIKEKKIPIGIIGLKKIDYKNQKAELGILIDQEWQNKGMGKEALNLLINFAWNEMNIRKIKALVLKKNEAAIKLYTSCGFLEEGLLKKEVYKSGKFKDVVIMSSFRG